MALTANWQFGMTELIQAIAAIATLLAVLVSLYLANRARKIKKKVVLSNDGVVRIVNAGDTKFTISGIGYVINDALFFNSNQKYIKPLAESRKLSNGTSVHWDSYLSNVVLDPGDSVETKICIHKNGDPSKIKSVFVVINYKIYYKKHKFEKLMIESSGDYMKSCLKSNIVDCFKLFF